MYGVIKHARDTAMMTLAAWPSPIGTWRTSALSSPTPPRLSAVTTVRVDLKSVTCVVNVTLPAPRGYLTFYLIQLQRPSVSKCVTLHLNAPPTPGSHQTILTFLGNVTCTPLVTAPRLARSALQALMTAPSAFFQRMLKTAYGTV